MTDREPAAETRNSFAALCRRQATRCQNVRTLDMLLRHLLDTDAAALRALAKLVERAEEMASDVGAGSISDVEPGDLHRFIRSLAAGFDPNAENTDA
jgi:hypothetical protein